MSSKADIIILSNSIFTATSDCPIKGYVAIAGDSIIAVGEGDRNSIDSALINSNTRFVECGNNSVMPGLIDVHCFFSGYAMQKYYSLGDDYDPEGNVPMLKKMFEDVNFIEEEFKNYMNMMNRRGVTSVKEMGFDNYYGFTDTLEKLEKEGTLSLRVNYMSQPVAEKMNLPYGLEMKERFHSDWVSFSGYNLMTDGSISEFDGELKHPYCDKEITCNLDIDWNSIEKDVLAVDKAGLRYSLHAQGDGAIMKAIDIFEKCQRDNSGKLINRHAITDLEMSDEADLERMGKLGIVAEIYPQIQSIANRKDKLDMIHKHIGEHREKQYWNRRKMIDNGVIISCGTDLPLLFDSVPESIYHGVYGYFPEGGAAFNEENMLTIPELLTAWTYGGAYNLSKENTIGSLEVGKKADIVVFSGDLFNTPSDSIRNIAVSSTWINGKCVYNA